MTGRALKRLMDVAAAGLGLVILAPAMALIAVAVRLEMGSPVLFRQDRPGMHAKPFGLVKFRTMRDVRDSAGRPLPIEDRITRLGSLLRRLSLDELPELWNVLKGEMSLVGPRPLLMEYLPIYTFEEARRHEVRPGVTGWAQVNGRHDLDWEERFQLDVWYVDHWSLGLDLRILAATFRMVVSGQGAGMGKEPPTRFRERLNVGQRESR
jgi:lipopolysaccharide/colanic/teichoic acid biosynthesis glycosyltransferase